MPLIEPVLATGWTVKLLLWSTFSFALLSEFIKKHSDLFKLTYDPKNHIKGHKRTDSVCSLLEEAKFLKGRKPQQTTGRRNNCNIWQNGTLPAGQNWVPWWDEVQALQGKAKTPRPMIQNKGGGRSWRQEEPACSDSSEIPVSIWIARSLQCEALSQFPQEHKQLQGYLWKNCYGSIHKTSNYLLSSGASRPTCGHGYSAKHVIAVSFTGRAIQAQLPSPEVFAIHQTDCGNSHFRGFKFTETKSFRLSCFSIVDHPDRLDTQKANTLEFEKRK